MMVVRPGKSVRERLATWPVLMSSAVVPPIKGLNTSLDSPKMPWQWAHLASHTSCPLATVPEPGGRPLKSGRTSMSHLATSFGVAVRPKPGYLSLCAMAMPAMATSAVVRMTLRKLDMFHLTVFLHQARLDGVVVIDGERASHGAQLLVGRLHIAGFVLCTALDDGGLAVPHPIQIEAGQCLGQHRRLQTGLAPVAATIDRHVHPLDLALARPGQAGDVVEALVQQHLTARGRGHNALAFLDAGVLAMLAIFHQVDVVHRLVLGGPGHVTHFDTAQVLAAAHTLDTRHHQAQGVA